MSMNRYYNSEPPLPWDEATAIFGKSGKGALHDASALERIFADTTGATPITAGTPVALSLDALGKLGPELVTNGDYSAGTTGFAPAGTGVTLDVSGDELRVSTPLANGGARQSIATVPGRSYLVSFDWRGSNSAEGTRVALGSVLSPPLFPNVPLKGSFVAVATSTVSNLDQRVSGGGEYTARYGKISVREVIGHTISQPVTAQRPRLVRWPKTGRRNMLTWTEDFSTSPWTLYNAGSGSAAPAIISTSETAPDGTPTAVKMTFVRGSGQSTLQQTVTVSGEQTHSVYLRSDIPARLVFRNPVNTGGYSAADVTTEWKRFDLIGSPVTNTVFQIGLRAGVGVSDVPNEATVDIWHPQLELGTEATPYQHVRSAYDITEEGVEDVWFFQKDDDGTDNLTINLDPGEYTKIAVNSKNEMFTDANHVVSGPENILRDDGLAKSIYYQPDEPRLGPELVTNGDFSDGLTGWNDSAVTSSGGSVTNDSGAALIARGSSRAEFYQTITTVAGRSYRFSGTVLEMTGTANWWIGSTRNNASALNGSGVPVGTFNGIFTANSTTTYLTMGVDGSSGQTVKIDNISVREVDYNLPLPVFDVLRRQYEPEPVVKLLGGEPAGLALDFVTGKAYVRGGGKDQLPRDINGFLNYASPSTKYVRNKQGVLVPGTTLRCDHDAEGNPLGLLIERQRTNIWTDSETLPEMTALNVVRSDSGVLSPLGVNYRKVEVGADGSAVFGRQFSASGSASGNTASFFVRKGSGPTDGNKFTLRNITTAENLISVAFNYDTGVFTGSGVENCRVIPQSDGGWRISLSAPAGINNGDNIVVYVGFHGSSETAGEYFLITGAQFEAGAFPTSYIKTEGSQVTRAADAVSLATAMFPWNIEGGTLIFSGDAADGLAAWYMLGTEAPVRAFAYSISGQSYVRLSGAGGSPSYPVTVNQGPFSANLGVSFGADEIIQAANGQTSSSTPSNNDLAALTTELWFGSSRGLASFIDGHFRNLVYFPRQLSEAELIARTTP